jgi:hypothetical protein
VYYRLKDRVLRFSAAWREDLLRRFFGKVPVLSTGWQECGARLFGFACRFLPDGAGGVLLLRGNGERLTALPLLTVTHGPYDPHTLEVALLFLRQGKAGGAVVNLGFSGREPLADENLEKLKSWGIPLNPSNIDVIYPYANAAGHPYCYKLEEDFSRFLRLLGGSPPDLVLDLHGCVGTRPGDQRLIVGLGGFPPYPQAAALGRVEEKGGIVRLHPCSLLRQGLDRLRALGELHVQFCEGVHRGFHLKETGRELSGRIFDPRREIRSLLPGEDRSYLPGEDVRWLPGAGGNALQRREALKVRREALCLHVEIPTEVRRRAALELHEREMLGSLTASSL